MSRIQGWCAVFNLLQLFVSFVPFCSGHALCIRGAFPPDPAPAPELTADQQAERDRCTTLALTALQAAIAAGYDNFDDMQQDSDLSTLHDLPEFKSLLPNSE